MISLRQHAISLAAVFLALAVGVLLGSGVLSNTMLSGLRNESRNLHDEITALNDQKNVLNGKLASANAFDAQMAGRMVHDALNGKSVLIFRAPDAKDDDVDAVSKIVGQAGGGIAGTVSLTQEFVDANSAEKLRSVVNSSVLPAGAQLSTKLVDQGSQAGDLLGIALLINRDPAVPPVDDAQRDTVLAALRDTGFIGYGNQRIGAANAATVVTGGALSN
ncbi:MAG: copper transporter, partial [Mycobacterium sp.]